MPPIPFIREFEPAYGTLVQVSPLVRRLVARNSGPFTAWGSGTYVVGRGAVAVIDPGPLDMAHVESLLAALDGERITHLVITHTHLDHSPAAAPLRERTGARVVGCGVHGARGETTEAGADYDFVPETQMFDGDACSGPGWTLRALATPGHTSNHICYHLTEEGALFTGDHVMGWSTTVVVPPDGDMGDYMLSLDKLRRRDDAVYYPAHGPAVTKPQQLVRGMIGHRMQRERQIMKRLGAGDRTIPEIVAVAYPGLDPRLVPAAGGSVLAHLRDLERRGMVERHEGEQWTIA